MFYYFHPIGITKLSMPALGGSWDSKIVLPKAFAVRIEIGVMEADTQGLGGRSGRSEWSKREESIRCFLFADSPT